MFLYQQIEIEETFSEYQRTCVMLKVISVLGNGIQFLVINLMDISSLPVWDHHMVYISIVCSRYCQRKSNEMKIGEKGSLSNKNTIK